MIQGIIDTSTSEVVLTVNGPGLLDLARTLRKGESIRLQLDSPKDPFGPPLYHLNIVVNDADVVMIAVDDGEMSMTGGPRAMAILGERLLEFGVVNDLSEPGMHTHIEPEPTIKGSVIAMGSTPLVIYGPGK